MARNLKLVISTAAFAVLILSGIAVFLNRPDALGQGLYNSPDDSLQPVEYVNETNEEPEASIPENENNFGDGSICADYEEGETPPAHLNCDVETIETGEKNTIISDEEGFVISLPPGVTPEQHASWWKDVQECYMERTGVEAPEVVIGSNEEVQAHFDLLEECGVKDMKEYGNDVTIVDGIRPANETAVEDDTGGQQLEAVDNMPTVVGTMPEITGPGSDECRDYIQRGVDYMVANGTTDTIDYFVYFDKYVDVIYCNDVAPERFDGLSAGMYVSPVEAERTVFVNPGLNYGDQWYFRADTAGMLLHETNHIADFENCLKTPVIDITKNNKVSYKTPRECQSWLNEFNWLHNEVYVFQAIALKNLGWPCQWVTDYFLSYYDGGTGELLDMFYGYPTCERVETTTTITIQETEPLETMQVLQIVNATLSHDGKMIVIQNITRTD